MKKESIVKLGNLLSNLAAGKFKSYEYKRQPIPDWHVKNNEYLLITNVNIVDVNFGKIRKEHGILIRNKRIQELVLQEDIDTIKNKFPIKKEIDGNSRYLIPGLSDIHAHLSLISEFDLKLSSLRYFDAQRQKNCEEALKSGCTFIRDSGGAFVPVSYLQNEIDSEQLLGPKIMASYKALSPKGGMWDVGTVANYMARMIFGGKVLNFSKNDPEILHTMARLQEMGSDCFKTYFEERPFCEKKEGTFYNMFTSKQAELIRKTADKYGKMVEAHSMFIKGSRLAIDAGFNNLAHLTLDVPYSLNDAKKMNENGVAIVPTLSLGCYFAMNCGTKGNPDHPDFKFFRNMLNKYVPDQIEKATIQQLTNNYMNFINWINKEMEIRKMPPVGYVIPEVAHGFARNASESLRNFQVAGAKLGVGTDGGTGITFSGHLEIEFEAYHYFGYSPDQILRMATLGNMEILKLDSELGSIEKGKYADLVLLEDNPLNDITAIQNVLMVFKNGRLYYQI